MYISNNPRRSLIYTIYFKAHIRRSLLYTLKGCKEGECRYFFFFYKKLTVLHTVHCITKQETLWLMTLWDVYSVRNWSLLVCTQFPEALLKLMMASVRHYSFLFTVLFGRGWKLHLLNDGLPCTLWQYSITLRTTRNTDHTWYNLEHIV